MQGLKQFLTEDKNTHLEHLEDEIINNGSNGHLLYLQVQIQRMANSSWVPSLYLTQHLK